MRIDCTKIAGQILDSSERHCISQRSLECLEEYVFEHMRFACTFSSKEGPNTNSPWLTPALKKLMFGRDKAKKLASRAGSSETRTRLKALRIKVNTAIKRQKSHIIIRFSRTTGVTLRTLGKGLIPFSVKYPFESIA